MSGWKGKRVFLELYGESHSSTIGIKVKGLPKIKIDYAYLLSFMKRRQGASFYGTTERKEDDVPIFKSGVNVNGDNYEIVDDEVEIVIENKNTKGKDYSPLYGKPRPSHADYASFLKDGTLDFRGGGRFSARLTTPIVALGGILKQYLLKNYNIRSYSYISRVGDVLSKSYKCCNITEDELKNLQSDNTFPSLTKKDEIISLLQKIKSENDSIGATAECSVFGLRGGIGNDYFEALECKLSSLLFAIPAVKAIEFGCGVDFALLLGSIANDELYYNDKGEVCFKTNHTGGINGGITNGNEINFALTFRPTPSISKEQHTVDLVNKCNTTIQVKGRHDACVAIRALPIIESLTSLAIFDELE